MSQMSSRCLCVRLRRYPHAVDDQRGAISREIGKDPEAMRMFVVAIAGVLKALEVCLDMCWKSSLGQRLTGR